MGIIDSQPLGVAGGIPLDESSSLDWQFSFFGMKSWHTRFAIMLIIQ